MPNNPDPLEWPSEVVVSFDDGGQEYSQFARENDDGTVSYLWLEFPDGYQERTVPKTNARLTKRPWEVAKRWQDLFQEVYGPYLTPP